MYQFEQKCIITILYMLKIQYTEQIQTDPNSEK